MLDQSQLNEWARKLNLSEQAERVIKQIRSSAPARRVQSRRGNVSGRYPSRKMGVTIQFESHRNELAAIYELEHDASILEFYDQPPSIKLNWITAAGRGIGIFHTPDFFVIRTDAAGYEECKPESELARLAEKSPQRYQRDEMGCWRCPPGESSAGQVGLYYRLRSSDGINWVWQRNIQFLEDYLRNDRPATSAAACAAIRSIVTNQWGIKLSDLIGQAEGIANRDEIYSLIATGEIYVDLARAPLINPEQVRVYDNCEAAIAATHLSGMAAPAKDSPTSVVTLSVGQTVIWDGVAWKILNVGQTSIVLSGNERALIEAPRQHFEELVKNGRILGATIDANTTMHPEISSRLEAAREADFRIANQRAAIVRAHLRGEALPPDSSTSERTLRHWTAQYRAAESIGGTGYTGLLPQTGRRGNRALKMPEPSKNLLTRFIEDEYETLKQQSRSAVYAKLLKAGEEQGVQVPSYKTFCDEVNQRASAQQTLKRMGRRAAYQQETFYWELELTTPRHGDRPFEIGHLDHTQADIELLCSETGVELGRPWLTFLTDAFSRRILSVWLTFDPPSYRSCMMALRECVRRHGRLPQILVVDGGREFESVYFETLLARYECTRKTRPGAQPRFGSVCERIFGTAGTQFFHNLAGNTQITRNVRQVTKSVAPKTQALWTLERLSERLNQWADEVYDTTDHPSLGQSPQAAFAQGLLETGHRPQRLIPYAEEFLMWTRPTTSKGTAKVLPGRGVRIHNVLYWCEAFRNPQIEGTQVAIRYDPYDAGRAWVSVNHRWYECCSEYYSVLQGRSEKEMIIATQQLRARRSRHSKRFQVNAKHLATFLQSMEAEEALLKQRLHDREARHLVAAVEGGAPFNSERAAQLEWPSEQADRPAADVEEMAEEREEYEEF
ncbi:MAG: Mu transposase C-terminal domain-containing protein [Pyrinomonadaceae bacterium]